MMETQVETQEIQQKKKDDKPKVSVWSRILNILAIVMIVFVVLFGFSALTSSGKGYNSLFGTAFVAVQTNSMDNGFSKGDKYSYEDTEITCNQGSFKQYDMIFVKIIEGKPETRTLQVGDVVTFWDDTIVEGKKVLNTHRIIKATPIFGSSEVSYKTKGDHNSVADGAVISSAEIVGVYEGGRIGLIGAIPIFLQTSTGFLILIVLPSLLLLAYVVYRFVFAVKDYGKEMIAEKEQKNSEFLASEKERMRAELLAEMKGEAQQTTKSEETEPKAEVVEEPAVETVADTESTKEEDATQSDSDDTSDDTKK